VRVAPRDILAAVMPGLDPGIYVLRQQSKAWMAGTSPAMTKTKMIFTLCVLLLNYPNICGRRFRRIAVHCQELA
jgi:hypothetical protein